MSDNNVRIISDGTSPGTFVYVNGALMRGVVGITFKPITVGSGVNVCIEVDNVAIDMEAHDDDQPFDTDFREVKELTNETKA